MTFTLSFLRQTAGKISSKSGTFFQTTKASYTFLKNWLWARPTQFWQTCCKFMAKRTKINCSESGRKWNINLHKRLPVQKAQNVLRICPRAGKYKFWPLSRNSSAISRRSFSLRCKNHSEFVLLPETIFPHFGLLETRMRLWQPAEIFFVKIQNQNEMEEFQTHSPVCQDTNKAWCFDKPVENFPAKIRKIIAHNAKS